MEHRWVKSTQFLLALELAPSNNTPFHPTQSWRYTHKTSGFKTSGFETFGFKTSEKAGLQNVRFTKRQVFKMSGCKMSGLKMSLLVNISKRLFSKKYIDLTYVVDFHKACYLTGLTRLTSIKFYSILLLQPCCVEETVAKSWLSFRRFSSIPIIWGFSPILAIIVFLVK
jgi:hypothetical protein